MLKNLLLVAIRNFKRDKWYSLLNILGLTIGITFSLFLIFYIKDELSYDAYNKNADRLYRITSYIKEPEKDTLKMAITQVPLAAALKNEFPEVEEATRFIAAGKPMFKNGDARFYEEKVYVADSNVFRVFTYQFIEGDPNTALLAPRSLVLTESIARKYFGKTQSVVGKALQNDKGEIYKVTAVIRDVPRNSHIRFNILISFSTMPKDFGADNWGNFNIFTYVLLKPNTNPAALEKKLLPMYKKHMAAIFAQFNITIRYGVQPIKSIHLHSDMGYEPEELGNVSYIYIFASVALFMLLIACINYMNLTTARSARRAKEIGIRKVTGVTKPQLVTQFLVESTLTALFALLLSIGLIALLLSTFNTLAGKQISFNDILKPGIFLILLAVVIFVGLVGGSYPAFYLSGFNPISILKGNLSKGSSNSTLRRVLVVVQFSISMIMLICTWVVYSQLHFLRTVDLGFNKQQVLTLAANSNNDIRPKVEAFQNDLRKNPNITSVSTSQATPGADEISFSLHSIETKNGFVDKGVDNYAIDEHFIPTLGMQIKEGRNFTGLGDTLRRVIVNQSLVKYFNWENPIGKRLRQSGDTTAYFVVIGVVKDFNQKSLYNPITPLVLYYTHNSNRIQLKLDGRNIPATVTSIERSWKTYFPDLPFAYTFLDQDFDSQYAADQKRGKIFTAFSILTILITCLGLLGLIAFTTEQRQKEISIRKVMGAGIRQIVPLLTRNFVYLVGLSCLISFPVAWLFMSKWLKIFPYNTGLNATPFLLSALSVLLITLLTVMFHALRAAVANPVKSLKAD
ncbi:ABC transporter permease [Flavitalea sp. BT771]|uniref:ABC transporter permease n=1 Tax=Flavitalea sp. BT771 TaxID=3063329 RepID=UPI0026E190BA|nr:ABC transporter permease [Flavitalea sp. BT771]MDO6435631.1 ABC transporter permease [Flavitalea sp. BT771]MDV6224531.1 ABC transporter permease [Flavitalea sp. BT771]